ncbi:MAG: UDP-N-acetylmuramoyl-tripeptide--D-alanyl-D-alanine ligase, partial [Peptococcaceae bacterium]|nr:UDP-N-acetylmuramoyl-tripeptide--D-alanyl-D-alanine ligase [Peptococcaceae bacterium]
VILVRSTLDALQRLARHNREKCGVPVIGITGSTGKTTTKDILAAILEARLAVVRTKGNLNNEIGLPLTLLTMDRACRAAVVEMAMRGPGEIDALCRIARPTAAVITNIGETHLERLGSVSNIAAAKGEILEHVPPQGFALIHRDSPYADREARRCRGRVITFGAAENADIFPLDIERVKGGSRFTAVIGGAKKDFFLPLPGRHNVINALAAIGAAIELGLTAEQAAEGLAAAVPTGMRLEISECGGITVIDDAYNANPASTMAALATQAELAAGRRRVAVLGSMFELGPRAVAGHREVGGQAASLGVDFLITVGDLAGEIAGGARDAGMPPERIARCGENREAVRILEKLLKKGDVVLVKGSRGMKMEQIVEFLKTRA